MVVPLAGRAVAAVAGGALVLTVWISAVGTLITPRPVSNWLTRLVDQLVNKAFSAAARHMPSYPRRDRLLAAQAPVILIGQLVAWLGFSFYRIHAAAVAVRARWRNAGLHRGRIFDVHPRILRAGRR